MSVVAHTMQYLGGEVDPPFMEIRSYLDSDYPAYREIYNDCFADMRQALGGITIIRNNCIDRTSTGAS